MGVNPQRRAPQSVGDVLAKFMRTSGLRQKLRSPEIYDCWPEVVGSEACLHSRVVGLNNCVLHVEVDSAPWLQVLSTFRKKELLQSMNQRMTGTLLKDIRFRIGNAGDFGPAIEEGKLCQKRPQSRPTIHET